VHADEGGISGGGELRREEDGEMNGGGGETAPTVRGLEMMK
jgi:hypothetical protein